MVSGHWTDDVKNTPDAVEYKAIGKLATQKFCFGVRSPKLVTLHPVKG
jgi:hypothetical protein